MRQAQKEHTDRKYRQQQPPASAHRPRSTQPHKPQQSQQGKGNGKKQQCRGSSAGEQQQQRGRDGERLWPGMSEQFRASQVRGGPNQFRTDKTLMRAFQAFVATFSSPSSPPGDTGAATIYDEFGVFGRSEDEEHGEDEEGGDWKDFLLTDLPRGHPLRHPKQQ